MNACLRLRLCMRAPASFDAPILLQADGLQETRYVPKTYGDGTGMWGASKAPKGDAAW